MGYKHVYLYLIAGSDPACTITHSTVIISLLGLVFPGYFNEAGFDEIDTDILDIN